MRAVKNGKIIMLQVNLHAVSELVVS